MSDVYLDVFGGFKSLTYFLGSEAIYDFPETDMIKNAKGWEYHEEENGYYIVKNNAVNKYRVDRYVRTWKYLYLTISNLFSVRSTRNIRILR